jgi:fatty-acid desaturase
MFAVTGIYHRYFCHNAYRISRPVQFLFAVLGSTAVQRGPLWWAGNHRHHHLYSDTEEDIYSPRRQGFYWWEVDVTYRILWILALLGIVRDLEPVPWAVLAEGRRIDAAKGRR